MVIMIIIYVNIIILIYWLFMYYVNILI